MIFQKAMFSAFWSGTPSRIRTFAPQYRKPNGSISKTPTLWLL